MKLKKILAGALAASFMAVGLPQIVIAADDEGIKTFGDFEYVELEDGTLSITGYIGEGGEVAIPETIDGKAVTTIEDFAFNGCPMTKVDIPKCIESIGTAAFSYCRDLTAINVVSSNEYYKSDNGVLFDKNMSMLITYPSSKADEKYIIPNSVVTIEKYAFDNSDILLAVEIPDSVIYIGDYAFYSCGNLTSVEMGNSITSIGALAFASCPLTSITIPENTTEIGHMAFSGCESLVSVEIPDSVTKIGYGAFGECSSLTSVKISNSVTKIEQTTFMDCISLTSIVIPDSVTSIGGSAFHYCTSLTSVLIPASVVEIKEDAVFNVFDYCSDDLTIYGYTGSYAETYAAKYDINFSVVTVSLENEEIQVEGALPYDTVLTVEKGTKTETSIAYDITLKDADGEVIQPDTEVTVKIPVPTDLETNALKVYRAEPDNTYTDMNAEYSNGCMVFTTDHFSIYILSTVDLTDDEEDNNNQSGGSTGTTTTTEAAPTEPDTTTTTEAPIATTTTPAASDNGNDEDGNKPTGVVLALIPAIAAAAGVIISKKRK